MTAAITGGIGLVSGLFGMMGGMRGAKAASSAGIAPMMYRLAGQEQQGAARAEAELLGRQGILAYEQSLEEAAQTERQARAFKEEQALRFASSGITLAGTPLGVLKETELLAEQEVEHIKRRGVEVSGLYEMQGLQMLRQGSAAAFSGFAQGLQSKYQGEMQGYQLDMQAKQSGLAGLASGVQGLGALFARGRGGGGGGGFGYGSGFGASSYPSPFMVP